MSAVSDEMSLARIERALAAASPLIAGAHVIGAGRPYKVALVALDPAATASFARERELDGDALGPLVSAEALIDAVAEAVAQVNREVPAADRVRKFKLLDEASPAPGDRESLEMLYADEIEALYLD